MTWIQTFRGNAIDFEDLDPRQIELADIAYALARTPRYNGHTGKGEPLSVAQHSVMAADMAQRRGYSQEVQISALLHDAAEAYIGDIPQPLKAYIKRRAPGVVEGLEARILCTIGQALGVRIEMSQPVKVIDLTLLASEKEALMLPAPKSWGPWMPEPDPIMVRALSRGPWAWWEAGYQFMAKAFELRLR